MDKYIVHYLTKEYGVLDDREVIVDAASEADALRQVSGPDRHAYYAEVVA